MYTAEITYINEEKEAIRQQLGPEWKLENAALTQVQSWLKLQLPGLEYDPAVLEESGLLELDYGKYHVKVEDVNREPVEGEIDPTLEPEIDILEGKVEDTAEITTMTAANAIVMIRGTDDPAMLERFLEQEQNGKSRSTVIDAIQDQIAQLEESES